MEKFIFGPIPSRRLGLSLGISPIPDKVCNYSCIYCQLGRTNKLTNKRKIFYPVNDIISEFKEFIKKDIDYDVVSICGEGEPTLYLDLGQLIISLKKLTNKQIVVITNGALLYKEDVRRALLEADIVMPSLDAYNEESFREINRPLGTVKYSDIYEGLKKFSNEYNGKLYLEIMFIKDINDNNKALDKYVKILKNIRYDKLYLNTPVRPPAEDFVETVSDNFISKAAEKLNGCQISNSKLKFYSNIEDDYKAILSIITRHPMKHDDVKMFLMQRKCKDINNIFNRLENDNMIEIVDKNYRLRK